MSTCSIAEPYDGPLCGVRVVDFSQLIAGPSAASMLSDLGADVIKVEGLDGELSRSLTDVKGEVPTFVAYNRGKRSIALNLADPAGIAVAKNLILRSDVVIEGFRPGVMERLGLGAEECTRSNEHLIYASLSAFGSEDGRPGIDAVIQAASGVMAVTGAPDGDPTKVGFQVVDGATGLALSQAILAALFHRTKTGKGSVLEVSLFSVATYLQSPFILQSSMQGAQPKRQGNTAGQFGYPTDLFATGCGGFIMLAAYLPKQWVSLCGAIGLPDLAFDERFKDGRSRIENQTELRKILEQVFARQSKIEWEMQLSSAGVICAAVRDYTEITTSPALREAGRLATVQNAHGETWWVPSIPLKSSSWSEHCPGAHPDIGEHTREILMSLGMSDSEMETLVAGGVIRNP